MKFTPRKLRYLLNIYGPYLGAGIKVSHISDDFSTIKVSMKLRWYNRNAVGTQFGGSLYSMVDPHLMLILMNRLGKNYIVWDKSASIDFIRPGNGEVSAVIKIDEETIRTIKDRVSVKGRDLPVFTINVEDQNQKIICRVRKVLFIKEKRQ